jgi:hypothetical protein
MTGCRLVSLPFSDHCEPLLETDGALVPMLDSLKSLLKSEGRYIELRPLHQAAVPHEYRVASRFWWHRIDLRFDLDRIFAALHKRHIQRSVRKATRLGVTIETGNSPSLLAEFYGLNVLTRYRHGVPVQPLGWFRNLADVFGQSLRVYLARREGRAIAAILTVAHKSTLVYKYGCSNPAYNRYGATPALFWRAIEDAKQAGFVEFDLGRSDLDNHGLVAFKDHLGARRDALTYYRCTQHPWPANGSDWGPRVRRAFKYVPRPIQTRIGNVLFRHFG